MRLNGSDMYFDNVLYVIGNGFDLHHKVESSFGCFREWMMKHDPRTFSYYEALCGYDRIWSDFETGMAYVSRDSLLGMGELMIPDKDFDEWSGADLAMISDYPSGEIDAILTSLRKDLHRWIRGIKKPVVYDDYKLPVDSYGRFLSFNYTTFLETEYGIESKRIRYIHGKKTDKSGSLVVGHGEDLDALFNEWEKSKHYNKVYTDKKGRKYRKRDFAYRCLLDPKLSLLPEHEALAEAVEGYYDSAKKNVPEIIQRNYDFFDDLYDIEHVYVWGFSFAKVDMPYISQILNSNDNPDALRWHVSYYGPNERELFEKRLMDMGVERNKIEMHRLCDLQLKMKRHI